MQLQRSISQFSKEIRLLIIAFVITLNIGFLTGLNFVEETSSFRPDGIETNYLGNENNENEEIMQFKKTERDILTVVHNHIMSMSIIFLLLGVLLSFTSINKKLMRVLIIEPFFSIILTFGGIYVLWTGILWFKYIIMISGMALTISLLFSSFFILKESVFPVKNT